MIELARPYICEEAIQAAASVSRAGAIAPGPCAAAFEAHFAEYVGARYAVAVNSADAALHLALAAAGIQPGDEVLTTPLAPMATAHAIHRHGAQPAFVDVEEGTLNLDAGQLADAVTPRTRAILAVHYGGNPCDLDGVYAAAGRRGLAVVEDATEACGALYRGQRIGSFGLTCFSFHPAGNLALGDGGMVTTNNRSEYQALLCLRDLGIAGGAAEQPPWSCEVREAGFACRMNDIVAAMGLEQIRHLDEWNQRRQDIINLYRAELRDLAPAGLRFIAQTVEAVSAGSLCPVRLPGRDGVLETLAARGIQVGVHYRPLHSLELYAGARRQALPVAEAAYQELISLPLHLLLSNDDVLAVCQALRAAITGQSAAGLPVGARQGDDGPYRLPISVHVRAMA